MCHLVGFMGTVQVYTQTVCTMYKFTHTLYILETGFMWTVRVYTLNVHTRNWFYVDWTNTQTQNWFHLVRTFLLIFERLKVNFNLETHTHTHTDRVTFGLLELLLRS